MDALRLGTLLPELPAERTRLLDNLGRIRREVGPITPELADALADHMNIRRGEVHEVASFYSFLREPVDVVRGPYTGFPIPADCEIAIEGESLPGQVRPEGPFGEWMGYYSDDTQDRPFVNVKTILYRNDPILTCAPQHKPVDETGLLKGIAGAAQIWRALEACGVPEVIGVWNHEAGPATRFTAIQIRQRYPGHARQALHVASSCQGGAYAGKWTVVVDEDIDAGDLDQVLWAMCTRFDPLTDIDMIQKAWASKRDPLYLPGNFNNRILIDACIPYDRKLKGTFPLTVDVSADLRTRLRAKFPQLFPKN